MPDIVLSTLNAKFIHAALGLRYLWANLGPLRTRAALREFDINQRPLDIAEQLLQLRPTVLGLGVYIWNVQPTTAVVQLLKAIRPDLIVVLGGPEVSHETHGQPIVELADYVIGGEADLAFADLSHRLLAGERPIEKVIHPPLPDLNQVVFPYEFLTDRDLKERIVYVEASRGCPFSCEFCLSSLEARVRAFPLAPLLGQLERLLDRGAGHLKFVDRTFNLDLRTSEAILGFLLERLRPGLLLHFEMIPDRLGDSLRNLLQRFPPNSIQLEVGIQTFDEATAERIHRHQDNAKAVENLSTLRQESSVHLHTDLIVGLPGESLQSFAAGFDRLVALSPQEIQVGILKRLRGTSIGRHDDEWGMVYSPFPPYELLGNKLLPFETMQRMRRFARCWDLTVNSGNFRQSAPLLWRDAVSPFNAFLDWADWSFGRLRQLHEIALPRLLETLFTYLTSVRGLPPTDTAAALWNDYVLGGRTDVPSCLRPWLPEDVLRRSRAGRRANGRRQARHCDPGLANPWGRA